MFASATTSGEVFIDITSRQLYNAASHRPGSQGMGACQRLMHRMMIPGDCNLTACAVPGKDTLRIRFLLPRPAAPLSVPAQRH